MLLRSSAKLPVKRPPGAQALRLKALRVSASVQDTESTEMVAVDLAAIQGLIDKLNDTCDQVDDALDLANSTMSKVLDQLQPAVDKALGMLDNAKVAADASSAFGMSDMGAWVTKFTDKMGSKVTAFSSQMTDLGAKLQDDLEKIRTKFSLVRANTFDKFAAAFEKVSKLVEVVLDIVEAAKAAEQAAGKEGPVMLRHKTITDVYSANLSISRDDMTCARSLVKKHRAVRENARSTLKFGGLNAKTLERVQAAIADARAVLEPFLAALAELFSKLQNGPLGHVLEAVEEGVGVLNQTAFDAVQTASSALPPMIKSQMSGLFDGLLNAVGQVSGTIEEQLGKITDKLKEANATEAQVAQAPDKMEEVVDSLSPVFQDSSNAHPASSRCALLLAVGLTLRHHFGV